jgi:hypothetical protein
MCIKNHNEGRSKMQPLTSISQVSKGTPLQVERDNKRDQFPKTELFIPAFVNKSTQATGGYLIPAQFAYINFPKKDGDKIKLEVAQGNTNNIESCTVREVVHPD